jgi:cytochrome c
MKMVPPTFAVGGLLAASVAFSFVHPWGNVRAAKSEAPLMQGANVPADVQAVLQNKCADCHSDNTKWPAWGYFAPGSWLMERDVHEAREHLDMSKWASFDTDTQAGLLSKMGSEARSGEMAPKQYLLLHRSAKLTPDEQELIYAWAKTERKRIRQQAADAENQKGAEK